MKRRMVQWSGHVRGGLIPTVPFFLFLILASNSFTNILSGKKPPEHMVEKSSFGTVILKDDMSLA